MTLQLFIFSSFCSFLFSLSVMSNSLRPQGLQHASFPIYHQLPELAKMHVHGWCHPTISAFVIPFSSYIQSFPGSRYFLMSHFFTSIGLNIGAQLQYLFSSLVRWTTQNDFQMLTNPAFLGVGIQNSIDHGVSYFVYIDGLSASFWTHSTATFSSAQFTPASLFNLSSILSTVFVNWHDSFHIYKINLGLFYDFQVSI